MANFVVFRGSNNQYYFNLTASNGKIIIASEGYVSKQGCLDGIASVRRHAPYDHYYSRSDGYLNYRFNLHAANNQVIARSSEGYTTASAREHAISIVKTEAPTAPVVDRS